MPGQSTWPGISVILTPEAADPDAVIAVNGTITSSGIPSSPETLNFGANSIEIKVTSSAGVEQVYSLDVIRGMQEAYIKASNTDDLDNFGFFSISIFGNTIAFGAPGAGKKD